MPIPQDLTLADPWITGLPDDAARRTVWQSFLDAVGRIHAVDADALGLRAGLTGELEWWERYLGWATDGSPPAALAEALAWCRAHRPADEPPSSLLWGDVRLGNVVFDPERFVPRAILDWDMASVGPAEMDLAWFLALEQISIDLIGRAVPGFGDRQEAIAAGGAPPRPRAAGPRLARGVRSRPGQRGVDPHRASCSSAPDRRRCSRPARTRAWPPPSDGSTPPADKPDDMTPPPRFRSPQREPVFPALRKTGAGRHRLRW